jgi:hypothetical protein
MARRRADLIWLVQQPATVRAGRGSELDSSWSRTSVGVAASCCVACTGSFSSSLRPQTQDSRQSMAEAFDRTFKRECVRVSGCHDAETVLRSQCVDRALQRGRYPSRIGRSFAHAGHLPLWRPKVGRSPQLDRPDLSGATTFDLPPLSVVRDLCSCGPKEEGYKARKRRRADRAQRALSVLCAGGAGRLLGQFGTASFVPERVVLLTSGPECARSL